jgi:hypothetical protein
MVMKYWFMMILSVLLKWSISWKQDWVTILNPSLEKQKEEEIFIIPIPEKREWIDEEDASSIKRWGSIWKHMNVSYYEEPTALERLTIYHAHDEKQTRYKTDWVGASWIALRDIYQKWYIGIALPKEFQKDLDVEYWDGIILYSGRKKMIAIVADTMNRRYEWTDTGDIAIVPWQSKEEVEEIVSNWLRVWESKKEVNIVWKIKGLWKKIRNKKTD